jgi:uncharacterized membrane protein YbhN (UPF0104 family)
MLSLVLVGVAAYIVAGRTDELAGAGTYLADLRWYWFGIASALEVVSIVAYAALQGRLLAVGDVHMGIGALTGITVAGTSIQNSLPGGVVFSTVWAYRQYNRRGADDVLSGWTLLATSALSLIALVVLAGAGLAAANNTGHDFDLFGDIGAMIALTAIVIFGWTRRASILRSLIRPLGFIQRTLGRPKGNPRLLIQEVSDRLSAVTPRPADWLVSGALALAFWAFDAACLVVAFMAVGAPVPWRAVPLAYAAGQLAANLPITPGGLGVVEGSLTIALVAYGGGHASTVAAVLVYRMISFWGLLPPGWICWGVCSWVLRKADRASLVDPIPAPEPAP